MEDIIMDFDTFLAEKNWEQAVEAIDTMAEHSPIEAKRMAHQLVMAKAQIWKLSTLEAQK